MSRGLLPEGHLAITAKSTVRALAARQMGYSDSAGCWFPLLFLVWFYIIGAPPFTRINLGGCILGLYLKQIWDNLMSLGFLTPWVIKNPDKKGCAGAHRDCSLVSMKRPRGHGGAYGQELGRNQLWLTGKYMQRIVRLPPWVTLRLTKISLYGKTRIFQKPGKGEKLVRLEEKWVISPYKRKDKQSLVIMSCTGYIN